jgi:hypothetical protein
VGLPRAHDIDVHVKYIIFALVDQVDQLQDKWSLKMTNDD